MFFPLTATCQFDSVLYGEECFVFNIELRGNPVYHDWVTNQAKCTELGMKMVVIENAVRNLIRIVKLFA